MTKIITMVLLALLISSCGYEGISTKYRYTVQLTYIDGYVDTVVGDMDYYRSPIHQYHDEVTVGDLTYYNILRFKVLSKQQLTHLKSR